MLRLRAHLGYTRLHEFFVTIHAMVVAQTRPAIERSPASFPDAPSRT